MTDHKFTGDDVIKALECFAIDKDFDERQCIGCAFETKGLCCENASEGIAKVALALINHQKVEIESLKIANEKMYAASEEQEAEIERLQAVHADMTESLRLASEANKDMQAEIEKLGRDRYQVLPDGRLELIPRTDINAIKAEAIKEFAERLKGKAEFTTIAGYRDYCRLINALVKEMTEGHNESQNT